MVQVVKLAKQLLGIAAKDKQERQKPKMLRRDLIRSFTPSAISGASTPSLARLTHNNQDESDALPLVQESARPMIVVEGSG